MTLKVTSTTLGNRVEVLDLLRGFALLGVFIANMIHFPIALFIYGSVYLV